MSEQDVPRHETLEEMTAYIQSLLDGIQWGEPDPENPGSILSLGYEQSANALWQAALAAFNYVAREAGVSGFQASWAALTFYGKALHIEGPFGVVRGEEALYPQYDLPAKVESWIEEDWADWLKEEAQKRLDDEIYAVHAAPAVREHWEKLADYEG